MLMKHESCSLMAGASVGVRATCRRVERWFLVLPLVIVLAGCSTMKVPELKVQDASTYEFIAQTNGLVLAVQPLTAKDKVKETFRTDLVGKGIVPILVVVENKSASSFLLEKEKVFVVNPQLAQGTNSTSLGRKVASGSG